METQSYQVSNETAPLEKDEIDWCLVVILGIFTGGIGVIIYFAIYYSKPQNKRSTYQSSQDENAPVEKHNPYVMEKVPEEDIEIHFCLSCGVKLERQKSKFCPFCGTNLV